MEGSCEYIKYAVVDSRQGVVLGLVTPHCKKISLLRNVTKKKTRIRTNYLDKRSKLKIMDMRFVI
jgi:hypothetical protein